MIRSRSIAARGYPLQGLGQLATIFEFAIALSYVGESAERAKQWKTHSNQKEPFPSTRDRKVAFRSLLQAGGVSSSSLQAHVDRWEESYRIYCMAKHGNPDILQLVGIERKQSTVVLKIGPSAGGRLSDLAQLVLGRAARFLPMPLVVFLNRLDASDTAIPVTLGKRVLAAASELHEIENSPVFEDAV